MNDYIAANFNLVLLRWPVHDITLNLPRHGEDHQTLNIWTVSDYSKDLDLVHQSVCWRMSLLLVVFLITSDYCTFPKKWRHSMSTIYLNWLHNKLDTASVKLIVQMSGPSSKIGKSSTKEGRLCSHWALGLSRWWRSGLDHIQWKFATHGNGTQSHHMWLEQGLIGWERSWIYREKGSPVFWLLQQPAWLENGFETELGTFKLEMEWNYYGNKVVINSDE